MQYKQYLDLKFEVEVVLNTVEVSGLNAVVMVDYKYKDRFLIEVLDVEVILGEILKIKYLNRWKIHC
jgi:hypothetical protein